MKHLIAVFMIMLLLFGACSDRPNPEPNPLFGGWSGMAVAIWPGDVDQPVTDSGRISFEFFENGKYRYDQLAGIIAPAQYAEGSFTINGDSITLVQTDGSTTSPVYMIVGNLHFDFTSDSIVMGQVLHPGGWAESHTVRLTKGIVPPIELLGD